VGSLADGSARVVGVVGVVTLGRLGVVVEVLGTVTVIDGTLGVVTMVETFTTGTAGVVTVTDGRLTAGRLGVLSVVGSVKGTSLARWAALATLTSWTLTPAAAPSMSARHSDASRRARWRLDRGRDPGSIVGLSPFAPSLVKADRGARR
jgi:hypothetical protein